jgi:hypothetical protein
MKPGSLFYIPKIIISSFHLLFPTFFKELRLFGRYYRPQLAYIPKYIPLSPILYLKVIKKKRNLLTFGLGIKGLVMGG